VEPKNHGASSDDTPLAEPFTLAALDECKDRIFQSRLDMETALLRRRYEIVISERCARMKNLDGLPFRRAELFRKDVVYDELKRVGLITCRLEQPELESKALTDEQTHGGKAVDEEPNKTLAHE